MKFAIASLLVSISIASATPVFAQDTIRIATEGAYKPWSFIDANGKLGGFEVEFANELCARIKAKCEITAQSWDSIIPSLNAGRFDAIIAVLGVTPKRQEVIDFTIPYAESPNTFVVLKDGPLTNLAGNGEALSLVNDKEKADSILATLSKQMKGKTVGAQLSSTSAAFLHERLEGAVTVKEYKTFDQAEFDLLSGRVDAIITNVTALRETLKRDDMKGAQLAGPLFSGKPFTKIAAGLRKEDSALKAQLNAGIKELSDDGTIKTLSQKWFGFDVTPKS